MIYIVWEKFSYQLDWTLAKMLSPTAADFNFWACDHQAQKQDRLSSKAAAARGVEKQIKHKPCED